MLKDVVIATRLARGFGIEFGATDASRHGLTEEMRQGRGDADYSSLFRQYFPPDGAPGTQTNGDEDQPRLAGIDEGKTDQGPENVPVAVETSAEVPTEAKSMGEVVSAPVTEEAKVEEPKADVVAEAAGHANAAATPTANPAPRPAEPVPVAVAPVAPEAKPKEENVLTFPEPLKEGEGEEPRGLWGGFWRRRTDD
jgi:hypothetical protein